jgi:hypothetical protein
MNINNDPVIYIYCSSLNTTLFLLNQTMAMCFSLMDHHQANINITSIVEILTLLGTLCYGVHLSLLYLSVFLTAHLFGEYLNVCFIQERIQIYVIHTSECISLHIVFNYPSSISLFIVRYSLKTLK